MHGQHRVGVLCLMITMNVLFYSATGWALDASKTASGEPREAISLTLQLTNGNRSAASRILGISRPTLARKLREYGLAGGSQPPA